MSGSATLIHGEPGSNTRRRARGLRVWLFWAIVVLATIVGTFVLPLGFPPPVFLRSSSYIAGFNNRVAALAVVAISLSVKVYLWWRKRDAPLRAEAQTGKMPGRWLGMAAGAAVLFTGLLGAIVVRANVDFSDMGYWQVQIAHAIGFHARLYKEVEFAYGPILFYWPMWVERGLGRLGVHPDVSYLIAQAAMQVAGLAALFYVMQQLPLPRRVRGIALAALTFGTLTPLLGMNYTMFRFAASYAAIVWIAKRRGVAAQAALLAVAEIFMLGISPEIGISFAAGAMAYAVCRAVVEERRWLLLIPVPLLAFGAFALFEGKDYFYTMSNFSNGLLNEIIQPFPQVFVFLSLAVVLAPLAVAGHLRRTGRDGPAICGIYMASLAMVPSALGRCDGLHLFFGSIGLGLVSLMGLEDATSGSRKLWRMAGVGLIVFLPIWSQAEQVMDYGSRLVEMARNGNRIDGFDLPKLERVVGKDRIYLAIRAPRFVHRGLLGKGQLAPSYFEYLVNSQDPAGTQRVLQEMDDARYVLMPIGRETGSVSRVPNGLRFRVFRFGLKYPNARPLFDSPAAIEGELARNFDPVQIFGEGKYLMYMLYRRK